MITEKNEFDEIIKCSKDPVYFIENYFKIQHIDKGIINLELYDCQKDLVDLYAFSPRVMAKIPRQSGKSTCAAAMLLWHAMFTPNFTILIGSPNLNTSDEIMRKIKFGYENLPNFLKCSLTDYTKHWLRFGNGSSIYSTRIGHPALRGRTISLAYLDEFAFVDTKTAEEFLLCIAPCLSVDNTMLNIFDT